MSASSSIVVDGAHRVSVAGPASRPRHAERRDPAADPGMADRAARPRARHRARRVGAVWSDSHSPGDRSAPGSQAGRSGRSARRGARRDRSKGQARDRFAAGTGSRPADQPRGAAPTRAGREATRRVWRPVGDCFASLTRKRSSPGGRTLTRRATRGGSVRFAAQPRKRRGGLRAGRVGRGPVGNSQ
jgi:hypothetical protein